MSKKTALRIGFGLILTAVILWYSVRALGGLHMDKLLNMRVNWFYAALSALVFTYANYIRALAYTRGMDPHIGRLTAFRIVGIGHAANMVLPMHAGEGLRMLFFPPDYSVVRRTELLAVPGAADFAAIMLLSLLSVPFSGFTDRRLLRALWIITALCLAAGAAGAAAVRLVPRLRRYVGKYQNPGTAKMMGWVMLSWVLMLASTWAGLAAAGFPLMRSARLSLAMFAATNIINFIPASPGGIGLFEYGTILGLGQLGVGRERALLAALLLHAIQYAALLPMGAVLYVSALHGRCAQALRRGRRRSLRNR